MGRIGHTQNVQLPDSLLETPGSLLNHAIIHSCGTSAQCIKSHGASVNVHIRHENGKKCDHRHWLTDIGMQVLVLIFFKNTQGAKPVAFAGKVILG